MAETTEIAALPRDRLGKGPTREIRRLGRVPAIIYGGNQPPESISLAYSDVSQHVGTGKFLSTLYVVDVEGEKNRVIPKDIQFDPVRDFPMHVDFLRLGKDAKIAIEVPVNFINEEEAPGLKQGGVLNVVRYTIEMICPADNIPQSIVADLTGLELGGAIHISDMKLPDDVELTIKDRDFTVATVAVPAAVKTAEEEAADALAAEEAALLEEGMEGMEGVEGAEPGAEGGEDADTPEDSDKA